MGAHTYHLLRSRPPAVSSPVARARQGVFDLPMSLFSWYIVLGLLFSFFGPINYVEYNRLPVLLFIVGFLLVLRFSYNTGYRLPPRPVTDPQLIATRRRAMHQFLRVCLSIGLVVYGAQLAEIAITNPQALSIANIGDNYLDFRAHNGAGYSLPLLLRFATEFFRNAAVVLGIAYWGSLSRPERFAVILNTVLNLYVNGVASGTQRPLGLVIIILVILLGQRLTRADKRTRRRVFIAGIALFLIALAAFVWVQLMRYDALGIDVYNYYRRSSRQFTFDLSNPIFTLFGDRWGFGISIVLGAYLTSGFVGLSHCLQLPFVWTWGLGSSYTLSVIAEQWFGYNAYADTYLYRMEAETGRPGLSAWNTIFPWLASDLTFVGAVLVFIPVGIIYGIAWREVRDYQNPVSLLMVATITIGLVFVPANNQLFSGIDALVASSIMIWVWLRWHKDFNLESSSGGGKSFGSPRSRVAQGGTHF